MAERTRARASTAAAAPAVAPPTRDAAIERSVGSIGPRVREQRRVRGLSLQQAATLAGVSAASIHKVERGDMVPTITTLLKLAAAFGMPLSSLVDDTADDGAGVELVRAAERPALRSAWPGTSRASITTGSTPFRLSGEILEVAAGGSGELAPGARSGERLWYVLDGSLEVATGGDPTVVRSVDSLQVLGDRPVTWRNTTRRVARVVQVTAPHDRS